MQLSQIFQILLNPLLLFLIAIGVLLCVAERRRGRLPEIDRFGLNRDEQLWLSQLRPTRWGSILNVAALIFVIGAFFFGKLEGKDDTEFVACMFVLIAMQTWETQKLISKLLDYINKLEEKK